MSTLYSVGLMNQTGDAFEAAGFTPDDMTKLRTFPDLKSIRDVVRGHAKIVRVEPIIDCDANPFVPDGWQVEEHIKAGQLAFDPAKISFYLSKVQKKGKVIKGHNLREELKGQPVLNANVLDYLLDNPELIPGDWKGKHVFFWGTIYRHFDGNLRVRYLCWSGSQLGWGYRWLGSGFNDDHPAAVSASI